MPTLRQLACPVELSERTERLPAGSPDVALIAQPFETGDLQMPSASTQIGRVTGRYRPQARFSVRQCGPRGIRRRLAVGSAARESRS